MSTQLLALENISKSYGAKVVLENVSFVLKRGERVGLVGENGSGKTTLARILLGENYDAYRTERERRYAQQAAAYEAQQEEMHALQRLIKTTTHNTGNGKPRSDNDKFAKGFFAGRIAVRERRLIRNAERRLETLEREAVAAPQAANRTLDCGAA